MWNVTKTVVTEAICEHTHTHMHTQSVVNQITTGCEAAPQ